MPQNLRNRQVYKGTFADMPDGGLIRLTVHESAMVKVKGSAFTATLQSADGDCNPENVWRLPESIYSDLFNPDGTQIVFDSGNYRQTLSKGFYALRFTAGTGEIIVSETQ